jgi:hypothetical protein
MDRISYSVGIWAAFLLAAAPAARATEIVTGGGTATVELTDGSGKQGPKGEVSLAAGLAEGIRDGYSGSVLRIQFVRPDAKAVGFIVWSVPALAPVAGTYVDGQPDVGLVYYEQVPGAPGKKLFLSDEWAGSLEIAETLLQGERRVTAHFSCEVRDFGADDAADTADDRIRIITGAVLLGHAGDMSTVQYYETGGTVYVYEEPVVLYGDGCSPPPDDPDDSGYYDSASEDDTYDDTSCEGDTYDDDSDDSSDDWDSGDDYESDSGDDWFSGDEYEELAEATLRVDVVPASALPPARHGAAPARVLVPLCLALLVLLSVRRVRS